METLQSVWYFFQNEILGMGWLSRLMTGLVEKLGLDPGSRIGGSVQFFLYDTIKIMVLLGCLIFLISYIQSFFPPERTRRILGRFHGLGANCLAALLGTVTPFCSCSSIRSCKTRMRSAGGVLVGEEGRANPKVRRASSST